MLDSPFDFFSLVIAIVAFIFARKAFNQTAALRARLDVMETLASSATAARPMPPPLPAQEAPIAPSAADQIRIETTEEESPPPSQPVAPPPMPDIPAAAPASQPRPGFEERIGTRWVVWVGGLTLALGGFFMVRYAIEALQIANIPAILTAAGTSVVFATVYAAYALYGFLVPATAFILLGLVALGTLAAALLHGPALAGLGIAAAFVTPVLVSSEKPDFWALYIYLAVVTAAAFGLARIRLWRWLAITTIAFALLWTFPCLQCGPSMVGPHAFHVIAGVVLAALLVVCGFLFGPPADEGQIEPISSGSLAAYLLGATLIVLNSFHADTAMIVFGLLVAGSLLVAWRSDAAAGAVGAAAALASLRQAT